MHESYVCVCLWLSLQSESGLSFSARYTLEQSQKRSEYCHARTDCREPDKRALNLASEFGPRKEGPRALNQPVRAIHVLHLDHGNTYSSIIWITR